MTRKHTLLITGGSSGIGLATAKKFLERGDNVVVTGRSRGRLEASRKLLGHPQQLVTLAGDTADPATVQGWISTTLDHFGELTGVVANAGYAVPGGISHGDPEQWSGMVLTNVLGPALLIHYSLPALRATQGRIILVGSAAGLSPTADNLYGATKYAVTGLAENARRALIDDHVGITLLAPGRVETNFWEDLGGLPDLPVLAAADLASAIAHVLDQPAGASIDTITVRPPRSSV